MNAKNVLSNITAYNDFNVTFLLNENLIVHALIFIMFVNYFTVYMYFYFEYIVSLGCVRGGLQN